MKNEKWKIKKLINFVEKKKCKKCEIKKSCNNVKQMYYWQLSIKNKIENDWIESINQNILSKKFKKKQQYHP